MADNEVARAVVTIVPTMEGAQQTITKELSSIAGSSGVSSAGAAAGGKFAGGLSKGLAVAGVAAAAVTAVAVKSTTAFVSAADEVATYGDNIDKMSQKMGISAEGYQEWDFVMQHCGTSMETLKSSMKTMANAANNGNAAFEELGLTQEQVAAMSQEDLFSATIAGLQEVDDTTQRTYLAGQLLGRGATELGALLNMSAEDTAAMKDQVHELGGVMSDDAVAAAATFKDSLQNMQVAADGVKNNLMAEFLPGMSDVMSGLALVFSGDSEGMAQVKAGLESILTAMQESLPGFLELGMQIITTIIEGLAPMLPTLLEAGIQIFAQLITVLIEQLPNLVPVVVEGIFMIASAILENLPTIIQAAVQIVMAIVQKLSDGESMAQFIQSALTIITTLALGLIQALPQLIPAVIQIIIQLVTTLIQNLPKIIQAAVQIILALVSGIVKSLPKIVQGAKQIITTILTTLSELPGKLVQAALDWGRDLIDGFVQGIMNNLHKVTSAVSSIASTVKSYIGFSEPETGPLSDFHSYAPDLVDLFVQGLNKSRSKLSSTMNSVLALPDASIQSAGNGGAITIPIYLGNEVLDTVIVNANQRINLRSGGRA